MRSFPDLPRLCSARLRRKVVYQLVSTLVITSFLLRPVTAVAVIYRMDSLLHAAQISPAAALAVPAHPPMLAVHPRPFSEPLRTQPALPAPAIRSVALAAPTPSGAKPAYPLNHLLDGNFQLVGTPPANHNFETAGYSVGAPPGQS